MAQEPVTVRVPDELRSRLEALAAEEDRSFSSATRRVIERGLAEVSRERLLLEQAKALLDAREIEVT